MGSEYSELEASYQRNLANELLARLPDPVLAYLEKVYGFQQLLGCGMWACAWRTVKGTVLKLTDDRRDAHNAHWLLRHGIEYTDVLAKVYRVRVITLSPEDRIFLIETELVIPLTQEQQNQIEDETRHPWWKISRLSRKYLALQRRLQAIEEETGLELREDALPSNLGFRASGELVLYDFGSGALEPGEGDD